MKFPIFVLLFVALLFAGFGAYLWGSRIAASNPETVLRQKIERARLIGASPKKAEEFLEQQGIRHTNFAPGKADQNRVIRGYIPNAGSAYEMPIPFNYDLEIKFRFNERDRVKDVSIERVFSSAP